MASKIEFDKNELEKLFSKAEEQLLDKTKIYQINYENKDCVLNFDRVNKEFLTNINRKSIVYCIWVGNCQNSFEYVYIGHAKETISKYRMIAHFSRKNKATGSQLEKIKIAIAENKILGATFIQIEPAYMRTSIEEWLIGKYSEKLIWNKNGKTTANSNQAKSF